MTSVSGPTWWLTACLALAQCSSASPIPDGFHPWGRYELCLRRVADTCHAPGAPCTTPAVDAARSAWVAVRPGDARLFWSRGSAASAWGTQSGSAFVVQVQQEVPAVCGCAATVTETIRGEFLDRAPVEPCTAAAESGCGARSGPPDPGDPAPGPIDLAATYGALRARVVAEVRAQDGAQGCSCLPCRIEYELTGQL